MGTATKGARVLAVSLLFALAGFAGSKAPRAQPPGDDLCARTLAALVERYEHLQGLRATFAHTLRARALNQEETESGTLYLVRGGRMRWEYTDPPGKLAVADGKNSYLYLPAEAQVYVQTLGAGREVPLPLRLLSGQVRPGDEVACEGAARDGQKVTLGLRLLREAPEAKDLEVTVDEALGVVTQVRYEDAIGNAVTFTLTDVTFPGKLPDALFRFTPPPGAKVIRAG